MRHLLRAILMAVVVLPSHALLLADDLQSADAAKQLVQSALQAELDGNAAERGRLLNDALKAYPDYAPAHWQSGQVKIGDVWVDADAIGGRFANDPTLVAYREKRQGMIDTADNHRELARWCAKRGLEGEARVHWTKVLNFNETDPEAIRALGLQLYEGRLLTRAQIEEAKTAQREQKQAMRKWQPQFMKWRTAIVSGSDRQREEAKRELEKFDDPAGIPAFEVVFGLNGDNSQATELNQFLIDALSEIPGREATHVLMRRALASDSETVRITAARALGKRPPSAFMPQLIAMFPAREDIQTAHMYLTTPDWGFIRIHEIEVRDVESGAVRHVTLTDQDLPPVGVPVKPIRNLIRADRFRSQVARFEEEIADTTARREDFHGRVQQALAEATGSYEERTAPQWLTKMDELLDTYSSPQFVKAGEAASGNYFHLQRRYSFTYSCFPAGTPILTNCGKVPIETIKPGDQVVSQNILTGELALQPVQQVTLRPAAPLVAIGTGGHTILATRGHPFWVAGKGWLLAKQLEVEQTLHSLDGPVTIETLAEQAGQEAYNLVVSDFGTYFVGDEQVLVHDNSLLDEPTVLLPGLEAN